MDFLKTLGIEKVNHAASTGKVWLKGDTGDTLDVISPVDGRMIATVRQACGKITIR